MSNKIILYENYPLAKKSPINVGGIISKYYEISDINLLTELLKNPMISSKEIVIFGGATNKVFLDEYNDEIAIKISACGINIHNDILYVESGAKLSFLSRYLTFKGYCNWNKLADIPGEIGGSIASNAGANGYAISDELIEVIGVSKDGNICIYKKENLQFSYRNSRLKKSNNFIIFAAKFLLKKGDKESLIKELEYFHNKRINNQPIGIKTLGSTFKNPPYTYAYKLIDGCQLRGYQYKNIKINEKHCNFLEIIGKTSRKDILYVIAFIKDKVYNKFDINLEEEIDI